MMQLLGIVLLAIAASACSADDETSPCTTQFVYGLKVTVSGGAARGSCHITVTASDGGFVEKLDCKAAAATCTCQGAGERPGTYLVELVSQEKVVASQRVVVENDRCHVITEAISFALPE